MERNLIFGPNVPYLLVIPPIRTAKTEMPKAAVLKMGICWTRASNKNKIPLGVTKIVIQTGVLVRRGAYKTQKRENIFWGFKLSACYNLISTLCFLTLSTIDIFPQILTPFTNGPCIE